MVSCLFPLCYGELESCVGGGVRAQARGTHAFSLSSSCEHSDAERKIKTRSEAPSPFPLGNISRKWGHALCFLVSLITATPPFFLLYLNTSRVPNASLGRGVEVGLDLVPEEDHADREVGAQAHARDDAPVEPHDAWQEAAGHEEAEGHRTSATRGSSAGKRRSW